MSDEKVHSTTRAIESRLEEIYEKIGSRPNIFSGRVEHIEAFVLGLEAALDIVDSGDRKGAYRSFRSDEQFGCEHFLASFERLNQCRCGFVSITNLDSTSEMNEYEAKFHREFKRHWDAFLTWRKEQRGEIEGTG